MYGNLAVFILVVCLGFVTSCSQPAEPEARHPNVLFISIDDLRPELGCYGNDQVISPNIDQLAWEGLMFNHCISNSPTCTPYRGILFMVCHRIVLILM